MRSPIVIVVAIAAIAATLTAGCGGERVVASVVDDAVRIAQRPTIPRPNPSSVAGPIAAPRSAFRLPQVRPRPHQVLPQAVDRAATESDVVTTFILCDGLAFYLENGHLPTMSDWPNLLGGYLLSQIPRYRAEAIGEQLTLVVDSPDPFYEAALLSHQLACAAL
jgi:hypothetical protein